MFLVYNSPSVSKEDQQQFKTMLLSNCVIFSNHYWESITIIFCKSTKSNFSQYVWDVHCVEVSSQLSLESLSCSTVHITVQWQCTLSVLGMWSHGEPMPVRWDSWDNAVTNNNAFPHVNPCHQVCNLPIQLEMQLSDTNKHTVHFCAGHKNLVHERHPNVISTISLLP